MFDSLFRRRKPDPPSDARIHSTALEDQLANVGKELIAARGNEAALLKLVSDLHAQLTNVGKELEAARVREAELEDQLGITATVENRRREGRAVDCPSILFNAVPKSASSYCYRTIKRALGLIENSVSVGYFPRDMLVWKRLVAFSAGNQIAHHHVDASPANCWLLAHTNARVLCHTRDIRQVMVSWTYHHRGSPERATPHYTIAAIPEYWFDLPLEKQFDWMIDNHLPHFVTWIQEWIAASERGGVDILFTSFEEFILDRAAFFDRIAAFCGLKNGEFIDPELSPDAEPIFQFRRGDPEEFRSVLSPEQIRRANSMVPQELMHRFDWKE